MLYLYNALWEYIFTKKKEKKKKEVFVKKYNSCDTIINDDSEYGQYVDISKNYCECCHKN